MPPCQAPFLNCFILYVSQPHLSRNHTLGESPVSLSRLRSLGRHDHVHILLWHALCVNERTSSPTNGVDIDTEAENVFVE